MAVDAREAQAALAATVVRLTALIRSIKRPAAHAVGDWTVRDVAVHLAQAWAVLPSLAADEQESPLQDVGDLAELTQSLVRDEGDLEMDVVADRIDAAATAYFAELAARPTDATGPWLVAGIRASLSTFTCHLLNESLVHGYDIARAEGVPWGSCSRSWPSSIRVRWSYRRRLPACGRATTYAFAAPAASGWSSTTAR